MTFDLVSCFQLYGYNAHLFTNLSEAVHHPHGVVGVAIMVQESDRMDNKALKQITSHLNKVKYFQILQQKYLCKLHMFSIKQSQGLSLAPGALH